VEPRHRADLIKRFQIDRRQKTSHLSKGQRTQLALIGAVCPEPISSSWTNPTSGLDPIVRREFIKPSSAPTTPPTRASHRFRSTHLIGEFEG